ncbi:hypothetical protein D9M70_543980 [compost metagenome]
MDEPGVVPESLRHVFRTGHVYRGHLDAVVWQYAPGKLVGTGITDIAEDQVIALLQESEEGGADSGYPRRRGKRVISAFKRGKTLLELSNRRIGPAGIEKRQRRQIIDPVCRECTVAWFQHVVDGHGYVRCDRLGRRVDDKPTA